MEGLIPQGVINVIHRYIDGNPDDKELIEKAFPEVRWKDLQQNIFIRMLTSEIGVKEYTLGFQGGSFRVTVEKIV